MPDTTPLPTALKNRPLYLADTLGMTFLPLAEGEDGTVVRATMPVDERTAQVFGYLSGGASLALEETLAGYGSVLRLPGNKKPVGAQVSASHVAPVPMGETVTGTATLLHEGRTTHLWNVDIRDAKGRLISTARVLNHIITLA